MKLYECYIKYKILIEYKNSNLNFFLIVISYYLYKILHYYRLHKI